MGDPSTSKRVGVVSVYLVPVSISAEVSEGV
jgi:hypothetical protein